MKGTITKVKAGHRLQGEHLEHRKEITITILKYTVLGQEEKDNPIEKWAKDTNRWFAEEIQKADWYVKGHSISLEVRELWTSCPFAQFGRNIRG